MSTFVSMSGARYNRVPAHQCLGMMSWKLFYIEKEFGTKAGDFISDPSV